MGISQNALARALAISPRCINEIVLGRRSITPEMSLKLGKFFKQSAQFWFNIKTTCDFRQLRKKEKQITSGVIKDYTQWKLGVRQDFLSFLKRTSAQIFTYFGKTQIYQIRKKSSSHLCIVYLGLNDLLKQNP